MEFKPEQRHTRGTNPGVGCLSDSCSWERLQEGSYPWGPVLVLSNGPSTEGWGGSLEVHKALSSIPRTPKSLRNRAYFPSLWEFSLSWIFMETPGSVKLRLSLEVRVKVWVWVAPLGSVFLGHLSSTSPQKKVLLARDSSHLIDPDPMIPMPTHAVQFLYLCTSTGDVFYQVQPVMQAVATTQSLPPSSWLSLAAAGSHMASASHTLTSPEI